jgi:four helix bundle protein
MNDPLSKKSLAFSVRIVELYKFLTNQEEFILAKQILRSGTSIGANICESKRAVSKADFRNKLAIVYKESLETEYWLALLNKTNYVEEKMFKSFSTDCTELSKLLFASIRTTKAR